MRSPTPCARSSSRTTPRSPSWLRKGTPVAQLNTGIDGGMNRVFAAKLPDGNTGLSEGGDGQGLSLVALPARPAPSRPTVNPPRDAAVDQLRMSRQPRSRGQRRASVDQVASAAPAAPVRRRLLQQPRPQGRPWRQRRYHRERTAAAPLPAKPKADEAKRATPHPDAPRTATPKPADQAGRRRSRRSSPRCRMTPARLPPRTRRRRPHVVAGAQPIVPANSFEQPLLGDEVSLHLRDIRRAGSANASRRAYRIARLPGRLGRGITCE